MSWSKKMTDRFKFRVWDNEFKKYRTGLGINNGLVCTYNDDTCVLEQCTGLKDKNGKLIYEGDIVHSSLDGGTQKVIYWDDGLASFMAYNRYPDKLYTQRIGDGYFIELGFEVIGNIHENADLLEVKHEN